MSQVLQCTQLRGVDHRPEARARMIRRRPALGPLVDRRGAEVLAGVAVLRRAARDADRRVGDHQVRAAGPPRGPRPSSRRRSACPCERAVVRGLRAAARRSTRPVVAWSCVPAAVLDQAAPAGDQLHAGVEHPGEEARRRRPGGSCARFQSSSLAPSELLEERRVARQRRRREVSPASSASAMASAASIPDLIARWMPLSRAEFRNPAVSPTRQKPSPWSSRHREVAAVGDRLRAVAQRPCRPRGSARSPGCCFHCTNSACGSRRASWWSSPTT